jgi:hypothetical protein
VQDFALVVRFDCLGRREEPEYPLAIARSIQSANNAVMMPSRPKKVLNQGIPANG